MCYTLFSAFDFLFLSEGEWSCAVLSFTSQQPKDIICLDTLYFVSAPWHLCWAPSESCTKGHFAKHLLTQEYSLITLVFCKLIFIPCLDNHKFGMCTVQSSHDSQWDNTKKKPLSPTDHPTSACCRAPCKATPWEMLGATAVILSGPSLFCKTPELGREGFLFMTIET